MAPKRKRQKPLTYYGAPNVAGLIERPDHQHKPVFFTRMWAMPNHETFKIRPIASLLARYVGDGKNWADPFAGNNSPAEHTNDHNPERDTKHHMEAVDYVNTVLKKKKLDGVIFDPPYSFRQISEHYKVIGKKARALDTSMQFYEKVKSALCEKVREGGYAISFGWNTNGFGIARGFEVVEIMTIAHGGSKNDTLVTVEKKVYNEKKARK